MYMNISISTDQSPFSSSWLKLSVVSLIAAGLFAVLLVLSRAPGIQDIIPWIDFFHTALVVHVNLSVLFWFMSFSCLFWSLYAGNRYLVLDRLALYLCVTGTVILIIAPFLGAGKPLINNYIPVLQHPLFFWATGVYALGLLLQSVRVLLILPTNEAGVSAYAPYAAALFTLSSLIALFISWLNIPGDIESLIYYEYLFWGGGHLLQFSHTCLLLFSWLLLSQYCGGKLAFSNNTVKWLFIILLLPLIYAAYIYLVYDVFSPEHRTEFTALMKYGGLVSIPLGFVVFWSFLKSEYKKTIDIAAAKAALICSFVLFLAGGVIGFMIQGVNVVIPAHYHGSIVGVTLAFMGVAYYLLPQMGYREPNWGIARVQPYIYGGGQLVQIIGWTIAGMNGVQRKSAGAAQGLDSLPEIANIAMKVASAGGGISIIGGFLFWIVMIRSMWVSNK
ncbi:MAG: cbb3-type cytochrome c oxidase subunit I [Gammaproteobacteria bacterium]|nr:cbb3-type cytochrome c oxidase subunit I [Gammaproteobacteria bacterium]